MSAHALYRHYDKTGRLLYVGITNDPGRRWEQHRGKAWWTEVVNTKIEHFPDRTSVLEAERRAIVSERPWWNISGNKDVVEYRGRVAAALQNYLENTHYSYVLRAGLRDDAKKAYDRGFNVWITEAIREQERPGFTRSFSAGSPLRALEHEFLEMDLGDGVAFNWGQVGESEATNFENCCEEADVKILDVIREWREQLDAEIQADDQATDLPDPWGV